MVCIKCGVIFAAKRGDVACQDCTHAHLLKYADGNDITAETRRESLKKTNVTKRQRDVLSALGGDSLTAHEITDIMLKNGVIPYYDRNYVSPRLTELRVDGLVEVVDTRMCEKTNRLVSVWRKTAEKND